jgi:hypothetical protein
MCTDAHISALVNATREYRIDLPRGYSPEEWFAVLVAENVLSLTSRYGKRDAPKKTTHRYTPGPALPAIHVIKLAQSYDYQSCEHDGWETSEAKRWIDNLIAGLVYQLPGYGAAPWAI